MTREDIQVAPATPANRSTRRGHDVRSLASAALDAYFAGELGRARTLQERCLLLARQPGPSGATAHA